MRPILAFVALAMALALAVSAAIAITGGPHGPLGALAVATMLIPSCSAWVLRITLGEPARIDWSRLPAAYLPVALLLIPAVMHAAMLPAMYAAAGGLPWIGPVALRDVARNAVVGLVVVSTLATFEEVGWRGWLQPRLVDQFGASTGIAWTSAIWASWHVPFVLSGVLGVEGVSKAQAVCIVPLGVAGAGLVVGWLWMRTRSIWIVALAHGAMNDWGQFAFKYMRAGPDVDLAPVLLAGSIAVFVTGGALAWSLRPVSMARRAVP